MKFDNICESIGNTPLVKLNKVTKSLKCNVYAKCEFMNPGGSVKDRPAFKMIEDAEKSGLIRPGDTIVEASSGNMGIGLALVGAAKGYNVTIVMPDKMSDEKQYTLEALGAKVIRTSIAEPFDSPNSHLGIAKRLAAEDERTFFLNQYTNVSNPESHYQFTAQEIWDDLDGQVDMCVVGAGTGGSITGLAKFLKEKNPSIKIVGVDPKGSIMAGLPDDSVGSYEIEGIGYDFLPEVFSRESADIWYKSEDAESFIWARRLISEEAILCGGSSGSAMAAAMELAKDLKEGQNCVVILPDGIRNYLTKFLNSKWLKSKDLSQVLQES